MADTSSSSPGQPPAPSSTSSAQPAVVVKKYANRRLYNTETSSYITLDNLAEMIRAGRDFAVYDAKSGEDITRGVLTQIIVEEESKGSAMLPTTFLRQLIGFYGGSLQGVVPRYLEHTMASFARQQQQVRQIMERTLSPFLPTSVEELNRHNMAMLERTMSMFMPFQRADGTDATVEADPATGQAVQPEAAPALPSAEQAELEHLRHEVENLRQLLATAHAAASAKTPEQAPAEAASEDTEAASAVLAAVPEKVASAVAPRPVPVPVPAPVMAPNVLADPVPGNGVGGRSSRKMPSRSKPLPGSTPN